MYLITDQMKINWLFLNSMFAWFMVTLTSLDISLMLCKTIHWALKLQEAKQHVYVVHYKEFTNILTFNLEGKSTVGNY